MGALDVAELRRHAKAEHEWSGGRWVRVSPPTFDAILAALERIPELERERDDLELRLGVALDYCDSALERAEEAGRMATVRRVAIREARRALAAAPALSGTGTGPLEANRITVEEAVRRLADAPEADRKGE